MIATERAKELMKALHEEMNAVGEYNTYIITEGLEPPHKCIFMHTYLASNREPSEKERKSFVRLYDRIVPYIYKRTKDFKDK